MEINGEYRELPLGRLNDSTLYAWQYVLAAPVESLYTFTLTGRYWENSSGAWSRTRKDLLIKRSIPLTF